MGGVGSVARKVGDVIVDPLGEAATAITGNPKNIVSSVSSPGGMATAVGLPAVGQGLKDSAVPYVGPYLLGKDIAGAVNPQAPSPALATAAAATPSDPETAAAMQTAAVQQQKPRGQAADILTSGQGLLTPAPTARRTLLAT